MNNLWIYLLKSGLALWLFYGVYWFFLRKETFFSMNRLVLLGSVVLSFLLPFLRIENLFTISDNTSIPSFLMDFGVTTSATSSNGGTLDFTRVLAIVAVIIYLSGIMFLTTRLIHQIIRLFRLSKKYPVNSRDGMGLIYVNEKIGPCSFFRNIFIHKSMKTDDEIERIVLHESAHIKNLHFVDLILFGIAGIIQWFNPVMWLFERSIREIHEYEADREVLKIKPDRGSYQALLINQVTGIEIFKLANSFSKSITKKRMIMMSKIKSNGFSKMKALLVLPVILCLVFAFSKPQIAGGSSQNLQPKEVTGKVVDAETNDPMIGAAVVIEGTSEGTVTIEGGKFRIQVPGNDKVLVISYVGYETKAVKADRPEIEVKMKKKVYDLPEDNVLKPGEEITLPPPPPPPPTTGEEIFTVVEEMPKFQGKDGEGFREYLTKNITYPEDAKKNKITGKVYVQFTVNTKGEVVDVKVLRSVYPSLDKEAVRVVESSPLWEPGKQKGKPVDVQFTFPLDFKLN